MAALLGAAVLVSSTLIATAFAGPAEASAAVRATHAGAAIAQPHRPGGAPVPDLGPNVLLFTPDMAQVDIQTTVDAVAAQQVGNQFGAQRYELLFAPGTYGSTANPLRFQVGYYTAVAGLGRTPADVHIVGSVDVYNQCDSPGVNCLALNNFWRSLSNLTIDVAGGTGCQSNTEFWAVSQASPMRRVAVNGLTSLMDYCSAGPQYASGGFIADSAFSGSTVINGSQQQFVVRNSSLDGWTNSVWNQVFVGTTGAPAQDFSATAGTGGASSYTTLPASPVSQEQPFLALDPSGRYEVDVPGVRTASVGTSWTSPVTVLPLSSFYIATPASSVERINAALDRGQNLLLTPGTYQLDHPIEVRRAHTVVLGLGFATLSPTRGNAAIEVHASQAVSLSGLILDAGARTSATLLQFGDQHPEGRHDSGAGSLISDVFFRVGGAQAGRANTSLVVNDSSVILDDVWAWRADHGTGVGWTSNTADTGVVVNGADVTAYGLFVEHFQKTEVVWNGERGTDVFFQNELPYDVPNQAAWTSAPGVLGYPAFQVGRSVRSFHGYGMGSYSFFNQGVDIHATQSFLVPRAPGVQLNDLLTVFLNGSGGIDSVVDGQGAPVSAAFAGPSDVVSFP